METDAAPTAPVIRSFRAHPSALHEVRGFVRGVAAEAGLGERSAADLLVAVSEAAANAIVHTSSPDITVVWATREGGCVEVEVRDRGVFKRRVRMPELEGRGHGIPLMTALVDELTIREGTASSPGTVVRLVKCPEP